ncbi:unnamed protein product [Cercopithifilaria johnstoni]|uniref:Uncharacterized protein n=1 Tax=Cercopithifilaria johnstoni TaxID=2874296 RepID=A0A8J2LPZ7_9BILA|nr:unnamed protein product [Cercopithifilaria johnstoni]
MCNCLVGYFVLVVVGAGWLSGRLAITLVVFLEVIEILDARVLSITTLADRGLFASRLCAGSGGDIGIFFKRVELSIVGES